MFYTVRELLEARGVSPEETVYHSCAEEMLDFKIASGDFYEIPDLQKGQLRFKRSADLMSYDQLAEELEGLKKLEFRHKENYPYCGEHLDMIRKALEEDPESVCVEGGPCLFGEHEVTATVRLRGGEEFWFDYSTGKRYVAQEEDEYDESIQVLESDLASFLCIHADEVEAVSFRSDKTGLTRQEYLHVYLPFAVADALQTALVVTLPDMSYRKYLAYAAERMPAPIGDKMMADFDGILYGISDMYLDLIRRLQDHFHIARLSVVHNRDRELVDLFETARRPHIERNKVLRKITSNNAKLESIKDYISMPALPNYIFGSKAILEVNSMDETDSYRKCRKAHKGVLEIGCILFPEFLSGDGKNTLYCAPLRYKDYGNYGSELESGSVRES